MVTLQQRASQRFSECRHSKGNHAGLVGDFLIADLKCFWDSPQYSLLGYHRGAKLPASTKSTCKSSD